MSTAIVIGSGLGGIAAALRLRAQGYKVTIVEALKDAGGRARVFSQDGFTFDAGPTVITAPYLLQELFELFNRDASDYYDLVELNPYYRLIFDDKSHFDFVGNEEQFIENIRQINPSDIDGYKKLLKITKDIFSIGYEKLADKPFLNMFDMIRVAPSMVKLKSYQSVFQIVKSFIRDERLQKAFSFEPLFIGGNPCTAPSIYLLIHWLEKKWGVHYAMGGTGSIIGALCKLATELEIEMHFDSPVARIIIENQQAKGVTLESGKELKSSIVVSNADPSTVYLNLIEPHHRKHNDNQRIHGMSMSPSLFVAYFGTNKTYENLPHHTIFFSRDYEKLLKDIFKLKRLPNNLSLYLHAPTRTDKSMAPKGSECFYVLALVPNQKSRIDWNEESKTYGDLILQELERLGLQDLRSSLQTYHSIDPRYFEKDLRSYEGAAFGPEPLLSQSAYFRYHTQCRDIHNLYFVGAGTHPGAGIPGVLCSARALESVVPRVAHGF